jgi:thiamine kinase-like enzyme
MTNFNSQGFTLFQDLLVKGTDLNSKIFQNIGNVLADLRIEMSSFPKGISGVEDRILQIEERTDELRISLYDNRMHYYNEIWHNLLDDNIAEFTWTDGHPKNIAVNPQGEIIIFDFGRSIKCDPEYPLANFLGQILLFMMTGSIDFETGEKYFHETIDAYTARLRENNSHNKYNLNEKNFVWYLMAEFAHRGKTMRWIDEKIIKVPGEDKVTRVKLAVDHMIDLVFDKTQPITKIVELLLIGKTIEKYLLEDPTTYLRPKI